MTIDLVLICLQTFFLSLYGVGGLVDSKAERNVHWGTVFLCLLAGLLVCIFLESPVKSNLQFVLLLLLALDYLLSLRGFGSQSLGKLLVFSGIAFMAYTSLYFQLALPVVWLATAFVLVVLIGLIKKWPAFLLGFQGYFLRVGTLLTLLFMAEPAILSVQQNLKPTATIPTSSIINQPNLLLLGGLLVLVLGGFFWKEKIRP